MTSYVNFGHVADWEREFKQKMPAYRNLCLLSVVFAFSVGLTIGILIPLMYFHNHYHARNSSTVSYEKDVTNASSPSAAIRSIFVNNSYGSQGSQNTSYDTVSFIEASKSLLSDGVIEDGIYWGKKVENSLPEGYREPKHAVWSDYVNQAVAIRLENGCGRMQNRLVTFRDGLKGCVRYRQNTDQIQGELFSFYLAQIMELPNLAPSAISIVDLASPLWSNLHNEIASAQWISNRPVVLTQFISDLNSANIPDIFKPLERHLNKFDIINITRLSGKNLLRDLVELAQWSDLIVFDYLTANLDRIVNNLYNYQWNVNIMDAPAHNLAKKSNSDLLLFLDNESGLLHGYRLLKKYESYHSILLNNLCLFRRRTAELIEKLKSNGNVGVLLRNMFEKRNNAEVKDVLPMLPDKSVKILNERIERVHLQVTKCKSRFSSS